MRGNASLRVVGIVVVGAALAAPFAGCNTLTKIDDYQVDCFGCLTETCGEFYGKCVVDPVCRQASLCFQHCSPTGTLEGCTNQCAGDAGIPQAGVDLIGCMALNCQLLCFGNEIGPPPDDVGSETGETSNDGAPGDGDGG